MRKVIQRIVLGFVAFLFLLLLWVGLNSFDQDGFDDLGLLGQIEYPKDEGNGYLLFSAFIKANGFLVNKVDATKFSEHFELKINNASYVDDLVDMNSGVYVVLKDVISKPDFAFPGAMDVFEMPSYENYVELNRFLLIKAMSHFYKKDVVAAFLDLGLSIKLSKLLMNESGHTLISFMVGQAMLQDAFYYADNFSFIAEYLEGDELGKARDVLSSAPTFHDEYFYKSFLGEYQFVYDVMRSPFTKTFKERMDEFGDIYNGNEYVEEYSINYLYGLLSAIHPYYFTHPNRTMNAYAPVVIELQRNTSKACGKSSEDESVYFDINWMNFMPNGMNASLSMDEYPEVFESYYRRRCHVQTYVGAVKAKYALFQYFKDKRSFPVSLDALVPRYLDGLPTDYFGGGKLRYKKGSNKSAQLYSLGENAVDNGGSAESEYHKRCYEDDGCRMNPTYSVEAYEGYE